MKTPFRTVCLTPTKNESWIIRHFLAAAKHWASDVIVLDQNSSDGTREILANTPGLSVLHNDSPVYDEAYRQRILVQQARKLSGKRLLIALDADEALSANCISSDEWSRLEDAEPGTLVRFRWVNILPGFLKAWIPPNPIPCGFIDDGTEHTGERIHSRRVPCRRNAPIIDLHDVVVLHFQYVVKERVLSKHRWYQAWERVSFPERSALDIFRQYHHMYGSWGAGEVQTIRQEWFEKYDSAGVDFRSLQSEPITWWDREVLDMLVKYGPRYFEKTAVWDKDWQTTAAQLGICPSNMQDPRVLTVKIAHRLLKATQRYRTNLAVRCFERLLRSAGW